MNPLCDNNSENVWILDSGASAHFTGCIDDFVEYELIPPIEISTANATTNVIGRGTVIIQLVDGDKIQISPVYYVPDMTCRLISLGCFLQAGLCSWGNQEKITVFTFEDDEKKDLLSFRPR
jgi:hypothetical protein